MDLQASLNNLYIDEVNNQRQIAAQHFIDTKSSIIGEDKANQIASLALSQTVGINDLIIKLNELYQAELSGLAAERQQIVTDFITQAAPEIGAVKAQEIGDQALSLTSGTSDLTNKLNELYQNEIATQRQQVTANFLIQATPEIGAIKAQEIINQALTGTSEIQDLISKLDELYDVELQIKYIVDIFRVKAITLVGTDTTNSIISQALELSTGPDDLEEWLNNFLQQELNRGNIQAQDAYTSISPASSPAPAPTPALQFKIIPVSELNNSNVDNVIGISGIYNGWSRPKGSPVGIAQTKSDWIVSEGGHYIYVTGLSAVFQQQSIPENSQIQVKGKLRSNKDGFYFQGSEIISITLPDETKPITILPIEPVKDVIAFATVEPIITPKEIVVTIKKKEEEKKTTARWPFALLGGLLLVRDNKKKSSLVFD